MWLEEPHGFARNSFWHYDKEGSSDALLRYTLDSSRSADILSQFVSGRILNFMPCTPLKSAVS
ncbi:MAG: hypothetical protein ACLSUZ_03065 [Bifidobacterium pseudocatenulatum]